MLTIYPAYFFKESNGQYSVIFPDLNYLATQGETLEEAIEMSVECLASYIYTCKKDNDIIPVSSSKYEISPNVVAKELELEPIEAFVSEVSVDIEEYVKRYFEIFS